MSKTKMRAAAEPEERRRITWQSPAQYLREHPIPEARFATPFPFLNEAFGGGFWPGQVYTIQGAPTAGKSSLGVQLAAYHATQHNQKVYVLASDEGTRAACVRMGQAAGLERDPLERTRAEAIAALDQAYPFPSGSVNGVVNVVDADAPEALFETFLDQIAEEMTPDSVPMLYADSIQNIVTAIDDTFEGKKERITYIMVLAREFTRRYGAIVIFVSHVNRQAFAAKKEEDRVDPLAGAAEAIEIPRYSDVLLDLSGNRKDAKGVRAWLRKNRLHLGGEPEARLRYDFARGDFSEIDPEELKKFEEEQESEQKKASSAAREKKAQKDRENRAARIVALVTRRPGKLSKSKIYQEIGGRKEAVFELIDNLSDPKGAARIMLDDQSGLYHAAL